MKFLITGATRYQATPTQVDVEAERLDRVAKAWSPAGRGGCCSRSL